MSHSEVVEWISGSSASQRGYGAAQHANAYRSSSWSIAAASDVAAAANPSDRTSDGISTIQTRRAHTGAENRRPKPQLVQYLRAQPAHRRARPPGAGAGRGHTREVTDRPIGKSRLVNQPLPAATGTTSRAATAPTRSGSRRKQTQWQSNNNSRCNSEVPRNVQPGRVVVAAVDQDGGSVLVGDVSPHIGDTTGEGYWLEDHGVEYDFHNRIEI